MQWPIRHRRGGGFDTRGSTPSEPEPELTGPAVLTVDARSNAPFRSIIPMQGTEPSVPGGDLAGPASIDPSLDHRAPFREAIRMQGERPSVAGSDLSGPAQMAEVDQFSPPKMHVSRPGLTRPGLMTKEEYDDEIPEDVPDARYVKVGFDKVYVRPETPLDIPVDLNKPEPVVIEDPVELTPDPITEDMIARTEAEVGKVQQPGVTTVTENAFREAMAKADPTGNKVVIDPNINVAQVIAPDGEVIAEYQVGTGDITGKRWGQKYFTPTGLGRIIDVQKRPVGNKQEGPYKMRLSLSFYRHRNPFLLHGQYELDKIVRDAGRFLNEGYASHGCVRFFNEDMNELFGLVGKGSAIEILEYAGEGFKGKIHPKTGKPYQVHGRTEKKLASL